MAVCPPTPVSAYVLAADASQFRPCQFGKAIIEIPDAGTEHTEQERGEPNIASLAVPAASGGALTVGAGDGVTLTGDLVVRLEATTKSRPFDAAPVATNNATLLGRRLQYCGIGTAGKILAATDGCGGRGRVAKRDADAR